MEEGRLFQTQKQMKEVFWQNRQRDEASLHCTHTHTHTDEQTPSNHRRPLLAKNPDLQQALKTPLSKSLFHAFFSTLQIFPILAYFIMLHLIKCCFVP